MKIILLGVLISIFGFAYAFSSSVGGSMYYTFPNLLSGFVIGFGGIVIAVIGEINRRRNK